MIVTYDSYRKGFIVDAFEVSARDASVLTACGGLARRFPGVSVLIPEKTFRETQFCSGLASSLAQFATEEVSAMLPKSHKSGTTVDEHRDSTHPGLVTECLMTRLLALGTLNEDPPIAKSVHDSINWGNALLPWRRSPVWLVLRVVFYTVARRAFSKDQADIEYKNLMLYIIARLGDMVYRGLSQWRTMDADRLAIVRAKVGRRMYKLGHDVSAFVSQSVKSATQKWFDHLCMLQQDIRNKNRLQPLRMEHYISEQVVQLSLPRCRSYIDDAVLHCAIETQPSHFNRPQEAPLQRNDIGIPVLQTYSIYALSEFESWVDEELEDWLNSLQHYEREEACVKLHEAIQSYLKFAERPYSCNPKSTSLNAFGCARVVGGPRQVGHPALSPAQGLFARDSHTLH